MLMLSKLQKQLNKKDKSYKKLPPNELQGLLEFRKRGSKIPAKKGKGSFKRKSKYPIKDN